MVLKPGLRLGPYEILSFVGSGGMGEVYQARDSRLDRVVAVKILPPAVAADPNRVARFEREARTTASLAHPHICTLHDTGRDGECSYFVCEYVDGETLQNRLIRGALPLDEALVAAVQIADALDYAHRRGVLHRDVKPANIMLTASGVKLLDFGLAAVEAAPVFGIEDAASDTISLTSDGAFVGTVQYAAPEQLEGRSADARSDLFGFGAVLYEMVTGRRAFAADTTANVVAAILTKDPPPASSSSRAVPPALDRFILRLLAKNPDDRWQTARDALAELRWIQEARPKAHRARSTVARYGGGLLAIAFFMALGGAGVWLWQHLTPVAPPDHPAIQFDVEPPVKTTFSPKVTSIAVSPDGRNLAFLTLSGSGRSTLWIRDLEAKQTLRLEGTDGAEAPFWSPDSRWVGFEADGALKKVDLLHRVAERLADSAGSRFGAAWNTDGTILFKRDPGGPLFRVSNSGSTVVAVTTLDKAAGEIAHNWPQFLPGGRRFLYLSVNGKPPETQLWVGSLDSRRRDPLLANVSNAQFAPPGFLLYTRQGVLLAQPFDPSTNVLGSDTTRLVDGVMFAPQSGISTFSVSTNGVLAFRAPREAPLLLLDRSGRRTEFGPPGQYSDPALSPDGTTLAVAKVDPASGTSDIWLVDLRQGFGSQQFTGDPGWEGAPTWSPDGSEIAYSSLVDGEHSLFVKKSDHSAASRKLLTGAFSVYDWSPDGRYIAYENDCCGHTNPGSLAAPTSLSAGLFATRGDKIPWNTLSEARSAEAIRFSPDRRWIAYQARESGRWEIYVSTYPSGQGKWPISTEGGIDPRWRADSRELFYISPDGSLMSVAIQGNSTPQPSLPQRLFSSPVSGEPGPGRAPYDVSPDGKHFVFAPGLRSASLPITVVDNWPAKLRVHHP